MSLQYRTTGKLSARIELHRYGTNPTPWHDWVRDHLPSGRRVLEVGAGTGALWPYQPDFQLVPTDSSAAMCTALRDKGFAAARCSADALPFPTGSFDGAVACHMLYHVDDPARGIAELRRVLRPGGWLVASTNGDGHMAQLWEIAARAGLPMSFPEAMNLSFRAENAVELLAAQFDDVELVRYEDELVVPTAEPVVAYLASCVDRDLTDEELSALRAEVTGDVRVSKHAVLLTARSRPGNGS
ncbi:class I SAM-dependent methyltransferase [Kutzneria sp. CA-103260]|uniref:class I SAM-dependent methyltransferase n=1 Tax=Kutzneria sp. CA-103260 TaxID=2802641 RepID=UPI001BAE1BB9|nr:class I SAM-dependent methyltransferase [Kutzneria sp. CA-103260]QUQ67593.1 2-methoxy-6-polyprenyl-1,4-benzoquinol methylase, mitochondrial [Kutzneria sp. CA-103260]